MGSNSRARRSRSFAAPLSAALTVSACSMTAWGATSSSTTTNGTAAHRQAGADSGELMDGVPAFKDPRLSPSGAVTSGAHQLVDAPANRILIAPDGTPALATDLGVLTDDVRADGLGHWKRLGPADPTASGGLPTAAAVYQTPSPDGASLHAATHGPGIWKTAMP